MTKKKGAWGGKGSRGGSHANKKLPKPKLTEPCPQCGQHHQGLVHDGRWLVREKKD